MTQSEVVQMVSKVLALGVLFAFLVGCGGGSTMPGPGIQEPVQPVPPPDPDPVPPPDPEPVPPPDPDPVPSSNTDPVTYWQGNSLAEDLSEHWNSTNSLQSALGLLDGEEGAKTSLQTLIAGAEPAAIPNRQRQDIDLEALIEYVAQLDESFCSNCPTDRADLIRTLSPEDVTVDSTDGGGTDLSAEALTALRNVRAEDLQIIGARDGITYGQWKGGPAGTLDIDFYWGFSPQTEAEVRARYERAGKAWSYRILDDFGTHVARQGTQVAGNTLAEDVAVDGMLIAVVTLRGPTSAGAIEAELGETTPSKPAGDYEPWFGVITATDPNNPSISAISVNAHEIGHILGIGDWHPDLYVDGDYWTGPATVAANKGQNVRFRDCQFGGCPDDPQATTDFTHLSGHRSIDSYERHNIDVSNIPCDDPSLAANGAGCNPNPKELISEIDFGYLADIGYDIANANVANQPETYGLGAWGQYSAWGVGVERLLYRDNAFVYGDLSSVDPNEPKRMQPLGGNYVIHDELRATADAFGISPLASFDTVHGADLGSATYTGGLLGVDRGQAMLPPVVGDAQLHVDLSSLEGTARFENLAVLLKDGTSPFRQPNLEYAIEVGGNAFADADGYINGGFFGPAHEEMAGVLDDPSASVNLLAGFGGKR